MTNAATPNRAAVLDRLAAALAAPVTHLVTVTYDDGAMRVSHQRSAQGAENVAAYDRRKIGKKLVCHNTGTVRRIVSVEITAA